MSVLPSFLALLVALVAFGPVSARAQAEPIVRVRLLGEAPPRQVTLGSDAPLTLRADGRAVATLAPGQRAEVAVESGRLALRIPGQAAVQASRVEAEGGAPVHLVAGRTNRRYHGQIAAQAAGNALLLVNHVPVEPYVASVVAGEYPFTEIEGVKAQAILARTYALRAAGARAGYDLEDGQSSQVYTGAGAETAASRRGAAETAGRVLTYGGALAEATYYASSGGHTADNEAAWNGRPVPYLRGVPDPYDAISPDHQWTARLNASRIHSALSARYGGSVTGFTVTQRTPEGRAFRVRLDGARTPEISGADFRAALNAALGWRTLKSTHFEATRQGDEYVLAGRGFGHGVGMSQYGARAQAQQGRRAEDILAYYFRGTEVSPSLGAAGQDPALATTASERWPTPRRGATGVPPSQPARPALDRDVRRTPTPRAQARQAAEESAPPRRGW